jgi:hypothetical protein
MHLLRNGGQFLGLVDRSSLYLPAPLPSVRAPEGMSRLGFLESVAIQGSAVEDIFACFHAWPPTATNLDHTF